MDYLGSMSADSQMLDSQSQYSNIFHGDNGTQDDYSLGSYESQSAFLQNNDKNQKDLNLEVICEEETPFKIKANDLKPIKNQQNMIQSFQLNNANNNNNQQDFRVQKLSQELDNIETETQRPLYDTSNLNHTVMPTKSSYYPQQQQPQMNEKVGITKGGQSTMSIQFKQNLDDMLIRTEKMMDDYKNEFCSYIDNHKGKFRKNVDFLKNLLVAETEMVICEEEKNKMIDLRMQGLFSEMVNILNDYHKVK